MLNSIQRQEPTLDELMSDAFAKIPLISKEWTNFNPSEPGVTLLESMSMMTILQQSYINNLPEKVSEKLFELAGVTRNSGKSSRVLLEAKNVPEGLTIPAGQKFRVGDVCFETNRESHLSGNRILGIFTKADGKIEDISRILDPDIPLSADAFTKNPQPGMDIYIVCDGLAPAKTEIIFYAELDTVCERNPIDTSLPFAQIKWQVYTEQGFVDIKVSDKTENFLTSGEIRFKMPSQKPELYEHLPIKGYVIRGTLKKADYDIPPKIKALSGFLMEVWQRDTKALCYTFSKCESFSMYSDILEDGYWQLFCKEKDGLYRLYVSDGNSQKKGRFFSSESLGYGYFRISFDRDNLGYGPGDFINAIKLVAYNGEIMRQYRIGTVYGYDNQKFKLPARNIVKDNFSIIAARKDRKGEYYYDFIKPLSEKEDDLRYRLMEDEGEIVIEDPGAYVGAELMICCLAETLGYAGNIRTGSHFIPVGYDTPISFINPANGIGGRTLETLNDLRERFIALINEHYTAVTAEDYERIVKSTPGLCIHKVKAYTDPSGTDVIIAVKPYGNGKLTMLSPIYRELIEKRIEERRLLTTRVKLADPVYAHVNVYGTIYVKPHYERCKEQIEAFISRNLDYLSSEKSFGDVLHFDELFHGIEALECVDFIFELNANVDNSCDATKQGLDIVPAKNCLIVPGQIDLNIVTTGM